MPQRLNRLLSRLQRPFQSRHPSLSCNRQKRLKQPRSARFPKLHRPLRQLLSLKWLLLPSQHQPSQHQPSQRRQPAARYLSRATPLRLRLRIIANGIVRVATSAAHRQRMKVTHPSNMNRPSGHGAILCGYGRQRRLRLLWW